METIILPQVLAQVIRNPALGGLGGLSGAEFFGKLIPSLIGLGIVIGAVVFVFMLIYGAVLWIGSGGDKMKMEQARSKISNALIGLVILLGFFAILNLVSCFFGIGISRFEVGQFNVTFSGALCPNVSGGGPGPGGTGNINCPGCITGGCGFTGEVYQGPGGIHYRCTASGWSQTNAPITSTTCGTCP